MGRDRAVDSTVSFDIAFARHRFALPNLEWTSPNDSNSALDGPRVLHGGGERRKSTKSIRKLEPVLLPVLAEAREQASKGLAT